MSNKTHKTDAEWRAQLSPEQYRVLREKGTEAPFTGEYTSHQAQGEYVCGGCGTALFASEQKFDSGCGWPSFTKPVVDAHVAERSDMSYGRIRTEVLCSSCDGHLGHVFTDGPQEAGGLRYCINSAALGFKKSK